MPVSLNQSALALVEQMVSQATSLGIEIIELDGGGRLIDCGIQAPGGLLAGAKLAEVCMAGRAQVSLVPGVVELAGTPSVQVQTDAPLAACMASQYAGWQISVGKFFAMGSGPMRAAAGREELYEKIGHRESASHVVGVLETRKRPTDEIYAWIAERCGVLPAAVTLLVAPTASLAGGMQVVARSVETALHKLLELKFDLSRVVAGYGTAPLPPPAADDLAAIGRTNDAVLYGGDVTLWVRGDDASLEAIGPRVPSAASADFGATFGELFERYDRDFYKIDPLLFSPARVRLVNIETGNSRQYGQLMPQILQRSFGL